MNKLKNKIKVPKTKRYKSLRTVALLNTFLLVLNIFGFFWVSSLGVFESEAATVGACLTICAQGDDNCTSTTSCADLVNPPAPEAEEEEEEGEITEKETTVTPTGSTSISPLTTPVGIIPLEEIQRVLVPSESDQAVYQHIYQMYMPEIGIIDVIEGQVSTVPYVQDYLTFSGKTNIKDAIIIISLTSPQTLYATIFADENGNWYWTTPEILVSGFHYLTVLAMSPSNAGVRQVYEMQFYIEAPPAEAPGQVVAPIALDFPDILPPVQLAPIEITKDVYALNLEVAPVGKTIQPNRQISLTLEIKSFNPAVEEEVSLKFTIRSLVSHLEFSDEDVILVKDVATVIKILSLSKDVHPGDYAATVELTKDDVTYLTTVGFRIEAAEEEVLIIFPGRIEITPSQAQGGLYTSGVFLSFLLVTFSILLRREYVKAKNAVQISGQDLISSGVIT